MKLLQQTRLVFLEKRISSCTPRERERERERDRETIATEESIIALEKTTVDCNEVDRFVGEKGNFSIIFLLFF